MEGSQPRQARINLGVAHASPATSKTCGVQVFQEENDSIGTVLDRQARIRFGLLAEDLFFGDQAVWVRVNAGVMDATMNHAPVIRALERPGLADWWERNRSRFEPAYADSLEVARRRAQAVINYWLGQGVNPDQILADPRGEEGASEDDDAETAALQRRAEFIITGLLD